MSMRRVDKIRIDRHGVPPRMDLPNLPPAEDIETKAVLKACIAARASLAELRVSGQQALL